MRWYLIFTSNGRRIGRIYCTETDIRAAFRCVTVDALGLCTVHAA